MKKYTFEIIIKEGNDEFWEEMKGTGCDEVQKIVKECLDANCSGLVNVEIQLKKFEDVNKERDSR